MSSCFTSLPLGQEMLNNVASLGYSQMTPVQEGTLVAILNNKDVLAQAKTGSGKTAAFALGLLAKIDTNSMEVQALVICPTRELCEQVCREIRKLGRAIPNLRVQTLVGGSPKAPQCAALKNGVHCIVGTPGRINDHIRKKTLNLAYCQTLVFDEADRMLEMGFFDTMGQITSHTPLSRQTLLFSATYPPHIETLSNKFQNEAVLFKTDDEHQSIDIEQLFFETSNSKKFYLLEDLLKNYRPESAVIFCNTKNACHELALALQNKGYYAEAIHGDLEQRERDEALVLFAHKSISILVATDVASRGIDIKDLPCVINYELSPDPEIHVHRIGRTGRAGKKGLALSLYSERDSSKIRAIEEYQQQEIIPGDTSEFRSQGSQILPPMATLRIGSGRKNKLRPADILGALTADARISRDDVGKIDVLDFHSFVAISRPKFELALSILSEGTIKANRYKITALSKY